MKKKATYTAAIGRDGEWRLGWIEEAPGVNRQESSGEELLDSLTETSRETPEIKVRRLSRGGLRERTDFHTKRRELLKHLSGNGREEPGEGAKHSPWRNPDLEKCSAIPRRAETSDHLRGKIRRDPGAAPLG